MTTRIVVGMSGSSGAIYGVRMLEVLREAVGVETHLVLSPWAAKNIEHETNYSADAVRELADVVYDDRDMGAAISSGSFRAQGMVVAPCSVKTLSAVANAYNDNLIARAADVQLKERRPLVLLFRETPFNRTHIRLMMDVTDAGAIVMPPVPSMYHRPRTVADIVDQTVQKALDQFDIERNLFQRWTGMPDEGPQTRADDTPHPQNGLTDHARR